MPAKTASGKRSAAKPSNREADGLITVENVNVPGYRHRVDAAKYKAMSRAMLKVVPRREPGLTQAEMLAAVVPHLPTDLFPAGAKAGWWAKTVQLDLEAKRVLIREATKPLRWHRKSRR